MAAEGVSRDGGGAARVLVALAVGAVGLVFGAGLGLAAGIGLVALPLAKAAQPPPVRQLEIELPTSAAAVKALAKGDVLVIEVAKDGQFFIGGEAMSQQMLHKRLREAAQKDPPPPIRLDADRRTPFQHLVCVLDMLQFEGLKSVSFRTRD
jgi:biopolymer transport protein ExbD